jgi:hypothetical protein
MQKILSRAFELFEETAIDEPLSSRPSLSKGKTMMVDKEEEPIYDDDTELAKHIESIHL